MNKNNDIQQLGQLLLKVARSILSIKEGADHKATLEGISKDIVFRGHNVWILIFSIFIASIGLNANSPATIIGAMLISPLMGPILGVGTSIAIHDMDMLVRSLKNLAVAVAISLITSTLYFSITPLNLEQSELLARTKPTVLDVLVAIFGGLAGIIAGSRKEKSNVIPGVAIATALMPPLCTAGFGLATGNYRYFFGAFYLFFINSVFISLSTFLVVKYLGFPAKEFIDAKKYNRYKAFVISFLVITVIPSTIIFGDVIQETRFNIAVTKFIDENSTFSGSDLITQKVTFSDTLSTIDLYYMGKKIDDSKVIFLNDMLSRYNLAGDSSSWFPLTRETIVRIHQEDGDMIDIDKKLDQYNSQLQIKILEDIYKKNEEVIESKDFKIKLLEDRILELEYSQMDRDSFPVQQIAKEISFQYSRVETFGVGKTVENSWKEGELFSDTVQTVTVRLKKGLRSSSRKKYAQNIEDWLRVRLNDSTLKVIEY